MLRRISIDELHRAGVNVRYDEAIAITQQLIDSNHAAQHSDARPPYGPPTPSNVYIDRNGRVSCIGSDATFAVSEIGRFLQAMLSLDDGRVPGSVRYTVARALLDVDAPPFDSIGEFSEALARYERADRGLVIGALIQRARSMMAGLAAPEGATVDRRRTAADVAELRRQLRDADARVYDQQRALDALGEMAAAPPNRGRRFALVAGLVVGLALIGVGEGMPWRAPDSVPVVVLPAQHPPRAPLLEPVALPEAADSVIALENEEPAPTAPRKPSIQRAVKSTRPEPTVERAPRKHWLRMSWLRTKIAIRHDAL